MQLTQHFDLLEASEPVETAEWIVEQQDIWLVDQRAGQRQAAPFARRKGTDVPPASLLQSDYL
jgi:hypothetical protein